jgi:hypothetical protein
MMVRSLECTPDADDEGASEGDADASLGLHRGGGTGGSGNCVAAVGKRWGLRRVAASQGWATQG